MSTEEILVTDEEWEDFKKKYQKAYKDEEEEARCREEFVVSRKMIEEHNRKFEAGDVTWMMEVTNMSDRPQEFARCNLRKRPKPQPKCTE